MDRDRCSELEILSDTCRCCGGNSAVRSLAIYETMFKLCTSLNFSITDGLPSNICNRCFGMLVTSYNFKILCNRTYKRLKAVQNGMTRDESALITKTINANEADRLELENYAKSEEVVVEVVQADATEIDLLFESLPPVNGCIDEETDDTSHGISDSKHLPGAIYTESSVDISKHNASLPSVQYEDPVQRDEDKEKIEEIVSSDPFEFLEDSLNEAEGTMELEKSATHSEELSIVVLSRDRNTTNNKSVRFSCPDCRKEFSCKTNMLRHQYTHGDVKPYKCDICNKGFTQSGSLKTHRNGHFNIKPFMCTICGMRFTQSKSVKLHLRCHTGEKPYSCDVCNAAFRQKGGLYRHMKVHGGNARD